MPTYTIGLPDGREVDIEGPEGATEQQVLDYVKQQWEAGAFDQPTQPTQPTQPAQPAAPRTESLGAGLLGLGEAAATLGTGMLGSVAGGLAGLGTLPFGGADAAADVVKGVQSAMTYTPRTESGQAILGGVARPFEAMEQGQQALGGAALEATGSPLAATAAYTAPDIVSALFGLQAFRNLRPGTKLVEGGNPTRSMRDALNSIGITWEDLKPEVRAQVPAEAPRSVTLGQPLLKQTAEQTAAREIAAGGKQRGLAPYEARGERIFEEPAANEAIRQRWDAGVVQAVKQATPETQQGMRNMLKMMEQAKANRSLNIRPSDVVGDAAARRLQYIAEKASQARAELNDIAKNKLAGKSVDPRPVVDTFMRQLDELNVGFKIEDGKPVFDFVGSIIQQDKSAQRILKAVADLMSTGGAPDALRFHNLKRQLDALIDWQKSPTQGITEAGRRATKAVRRALNESLRDPAIDPGYARVNDILSETLTLFDEIDNATASKISVAGALDDPRMLGQELRKLFSNYQTRTLLDNSIKNMDELAKKFTTSRSREVGEFTGGEGMVDVPKFGDNIYDLAMFANALDEQFGAVARTSLGGTMESAVKHANRAANMGVSGAATTAAFEKLAEAARKWQNIDEYNAYRSMEDLLKRGGK